MLVHSAATSINCGYARVAISELSPCRRFVNKQERQDEFQKLFGLPSYSIPSNYYDEPRKYKQSAFNKQADAVIDGFQCKWHPLEAKGAYESTFAIQKWKDLSPEDKSKHSLSNCIACYDNHYSTQLLYPVKPTFIPECSVVTLDSTNTERENAKRILSESNRLWEQTYGHNFSDALPKLCPDTNLTQKVSKQQRKQNRIRDRKIVQHVSEQMASNVTLVTLSSGESMAGYHRKRMAMSFDNDTSQPTSKKQKHHSPSDENRNWNSDAVLEDLRQWPQDVQINWSSFARSHRVPGKNGGQTVKEFAKEHGIDTFTLDKRSTTPRTRPRKCKLPGGEISSPSLPSVKFIQDERDKMINDGTLSIGEPCAPFNVTRYRTTPGGTIETQEITVYGRKVPLLELREQMLKHHEKYMRLLTDYEINRLSKEDVKTQFKKQAVRFDDSLDLADLQNKLAQTQQTRHLVLWHDHATVLGSGYVLVTVHVLYDEAVHLSDREYQEKVGQAIQNGYVQHHVEEPYVYIMAASSSSKEDQASLIPDRVECLSDFTQMTTTTNGIQIQDILRFFKGDSPAQQFERGYQQGGYYKCGACLIHSSRIEDMAHACGQKWCSILDIQQMAIKGKFGRKAGALEPFKSLSLDQLQQELRVRDILHTSKNKKEAEAVLTDALKGVQRVPSILITNPTKNPVDLHLQHYTILGSEPLHDIKGHLSNVFTELIYVLEGDLKESCKKIISYNTRKDKVSCADFRLTAIQVYLKLREELPAENRILLLMETAVRISSLLYLHTSSRSPKRVLELYNSTWLHHMLCREVFPTTKGITRTKLFGTYLHHLCAHAPQQYEIVPLRSVNTEHEERLFGQAKQIALKASNRQPENAIFNIFVCLSASKVLGELKVSTQKQDTQVSRAATHLPSFQGTNIPKQFVQDHSPHWQAHLKRISSFLVHGVDVWWHSDTNSYIFHDGTNDPEYRQEGPYLIHYRDANVESVCARTESCWNEIIKKQVKVPATRIKLYDQHGNPKGELHFDTPGPTGYILDPLLSTPTNASNTTTAYLTPSNPELHHLASRILFSTTSDQDQIENDPMSQNIDPIPQNNLQTTDNHVHDTPMLTCEQEENNDIHECTTLEGVSLESLLQEPTGTLERSRTKNKAC